MIEWTTDDVKFDDVKGKVVCTMNNDYGADYYIAHYIQNFDVYKAMMVKGYAKCCVLPGVPAVSVGETILLYKDTPPFIMVHETNTPPLFSASYRDHLESHTYIASSREEVILLWNDFVLKHNNWETQNV